MKRRGKGEGSVFYNKTLGRWQGQVELPRGLDGKRNRKTVYGATQREVVAKQGTLGVQADQGILVASSTPTVKVWLEHWWTRGLKSNGTPWAPKTKEGYREAIDSYLLPALGHYKLEKLSSLVVEAWADQHRKKDGRPRVVIARALDVLRSALTAARRKQLVVQNSVSNVSVEKAKRKPIRTLDATQAAAFLTVIAPHRLYALFLVALSCGLRFGEAIGLQWKYVNLDTGVIQVRQQLQWLEHAKVPVLRALKSEKSQRDLVLPARLLTALRAHRTRQLEERLKAGGRWNKTVLMDTDEGRIAVENDLVFTSYRTCGKSKSADGRWAWAPVGQPLRLQVIHLVLDGLLAKADLPNLHFHELRHSAVSLLIAADVKIEQVQQLVGHARIGTTTAIYGHLQKATATRAAGVMDTLLGTGTDAAKPRRKPQAVR